MSREQDNAVNSPADSHAKSAAVEQQLARILESRAFKNLRRLKSFLRFVVEETLADRSAFIKARTVAIHVFDRDPSEKPDDDPIVRIQAGRLRRALNDYYEDEGAQDPIRIDIPKGSYVPEWSTRRVEQSSLPQPARLNGDMHLPRIAVLPLKNVGDSVEHDVFADGLSEELSIQLGRLQGLAVIAYWTTSQASSACLDGLSFGREVAADFLVCGSVARSADDVRVSVECIRLENGEQIWAEHFDGKLIVGNLFDLQDAIVKRVVACVGDVYGSIPLDLYRASRGKPVNRLTAYEAVLANHHYVRCLDEATHVHTRAALEHAVEIEPSYGLAWAMLGALYGDIHAYGLSPLDSPLEQAELCVQRAMNLDPDCQHAHYSAGFIGALTQDHARIVAACDNIVRLNPNAAFMVGAASVWLGIAGQFDRAFPLLERSLQLNPYHPGWFHFLPWLHAFTNRDYERALAAASQLNIQMNFWDPLLRAATLGQLGDTEKAALAYQELVALQPDFASQPNHYISCYIHAEQTRAEVLEGLRVAGLP